MAKINIGFFSEALGMCVSCDVLLPQRREPKRDDAPLPVLWLLHGAKGNHADWTRNSSIERYTKPLGLCVIMPSAQNSGYADMAHGGRYFTYITEELPQKMRAFFPLSDRREDNFVCGLSMGGAGAFQIGLARPENYSVIGCLSAGAQNSTGKLMNSPAGAWIKGDKPMEGTYLDPLSMAKKIVKEGLPCPRVYHTCGKDDFLLSCAHEARDYFTSLPGNPFSYVYEEDEGAHQWSYWDEHVQRFIEYLGLPLPAPDTFTK